MTTQYYFALTTWIGILALGSAVSGQPATTQPAWKAGMPIPVYIDPYYDSQGPLINVGEFSDKLKSATAANLKDVTADMKKQWDHLAVETMYVTAIRLYDLGLKDEAVYWFYSAQFRAKLFQAALKNKPDAKLGDKTFESVAAFGAFQQLAGEYINGYAFGDTAQLMATLKKVREENEKAMPDLAAAYKGVDFIPRDQWSAQAKIIGGGLGELVDYISSHADDLAAQRKKNGVESKY